MVRLVPTTSWWRDLDHAPQWEVVPLAVFTGTEGDDRIHGRKTTDTIDGLGGDDVLNARYGDDTVNGGDGDDLLKGSTGRDMLSGDDGDDIIFGGTKRQEGGGSGRDQLFGGAGNDRLYGGWESDVLEGGSGKDRFIYTALSDATIQHPDVIRDFGKGHDKIVFGGDFREANLHFIGDAEFSKAPGEVRFEVFRDAKQFLVELDIDGDGAADSRVVFPTEIQFQASDFVF